MLSELSETDLLTGALNLDSHILTEIHDRYYQEIYRYAYLRIEDENLAEDIASEVFLCLLDAIHNGKPPTNNLRGWLFGVASHLVLVSHRNFQ